MGNLDVSSTASSKSRAADSTAPSLSGAAAICSPTGSPDSVNPQGTDMAGAPITVMAYAIEHHSI